MRRKLKVAIVARGGWSLGPFTGGTAWELVRQLHSSLDRERYTSVEIDVLAGSGAGALTLAVLLRSLANPEDFPAAEVIARVGEAQRAAWLDGMDFARLLRSTEVRKPALLERQAVDGLVSGLLTWPADCTPNPMLLGERVLFGITLLNFNGIPIRSAQLPALPAMVSTTRFLDQRTFAFAFGGAPAEPPLPHWRDCSGPRIALPGTWHEVAATAVASGAFPIAFEPVVLQRYREEFGALWPPELGERPDFPFTYGDGGPFQRDPLREALRLIRHQDAHEPPDAFERVLVFVDPNLSGSRHAFGLQFHFPYMLSTDRAGANGEDVVPTEPAAHLVAITNRFGVLARHQSTFEELVDEAKTNARAAWRTTLRGLLGELAGASGEAAAAALTSEAEARLERMLAEEELVEVPRGRARIEARAVIERVALEETGVDASLEDLSPPARLGYTLMALLDQVADLRERRPLRTVVVAPTGFRANPGEPPIPIRLAGDFFANFGGFFDARFRVYDFEAGRALAAAALAAEALIDADAERPGIAPWSDRPPSLDVVPAARDRFVRRIAEPVRQLLDYKIGYLGVSQAISIVAKYVTPRLVRDSGPGRRTAFARVEVTCTEGAADFFLAGGRHRGGEAHVLQAGDVSVLHTVLHFSDADIIGPHVVPSPRGPSLRLTDRNATGRTRFLDLPLPALDTLHTSADSGLPVHRIQVDWSTRTVGAWTLEDALKEWPGGYHPDTARK